HERRGLGASLVHLLLALPTADFLQDLTHPRRPPGASGSLRWPQLDGCGEIRPSPGGNYETRPDASLESSCNCTVRVCVRRVRRGLVALPRSQRLRYFAGQGISGAARPREGSRLANRRSVRKVLAGPHGAPRLPDGVRERTT